MRSRFDKQSLPPVSSPCEAGINLEKNSLQANNNEIKLYQQRIGALLHLALKTRPDITYAVNRVSRLRSNPKKTHFRAFGLYIEIAQ